MASITATAMDENLLFNSNFTKYLQINNQNLSNFIRSIPSSFNTALKRLSEVPVPEVGDNIFKNRENLKKSIYNFHQQAGTLTYKVKSQLEMLCDKNIKIIVAIHQPNLFAFSGVFKKIVLLQILSEHLKNSKEPLLPLFLVIDHDFMDDSWVHVAKLPSGRNASGILDIRYPMNELKRWKLICNSEPPTHSVVNYWENQIYLWIKNDKSLSKSQKKKVSDNMRQFWNIVEDSLSIADNYSNFNSIIMSKLINDVWGHKTLFVNLSDLYNTFNDGYNFLISNSQTYINSLEKSELFFKNHGISKGISSNSSKYSPLWLNCSCGSKGYTTGKKKADGHIDLNGKCISCKRDLTLRVGKNNEIDIPNENLNRVSPRAIPILLLLSRELQIASYVTGTGGSLGYTIIGKNVFDALKIKMPLLLLWPAIDVYKGFAQREALDLLNQNDISNISSFLIDAYNKISEYREKIVPVISKRDKFYNSKETLSTLLKELMIYKNEQRRLKSKTKIAVKASNALTLRPCIIDYIVNFGMENIAELWSRNLIKNNDFSSPLILKSAITDEKN
ncbi:MAG: hypothetical protein ACTHKF_10500 [Candidatus Nitrosocosmicus sp.]